MGLLDKDEILDSRASRKFLVISFVSSEEPLAFESWRDVKEYGKLLTVEDIFINGLIKSLALKCIKFLKIIRI